MDPSEDGLAIVRLSFFLMVIYIFTIIYYCLLYCLLLYIYILSLFLGCMLIMHYEHIYMEDMHVYYLCRYMVVLCGFAGLSLRG